MTLDPQSTAAAAPSASPAATTAKAATTSPAATLHPATAALHADRRPDLDTDSALSPAIHYSSTFRAKDAAAFADMASQPRHTRYYTRYGNPGHERVAAVISRLEAPNRAADDDSIGALLTGSGMGAICTAVMAMVQAGDHVVAQRNHYMGTSKLVAETLPRFGVQGTIVDQADTAAFAAAIRPNTRLMLLESPTNPNLALTDLRAVIALAKAHGIRTLVDNTFATPINQRPLALGADIVVHSATKYLGGHHDLTAGVIVAQQALIDTIWQTQITLGTTCSPMDSWLMLRGLRTLPLRVAHQNQSAQRIAEFLAKHPNVDKVYYPGLASHPQHALAQAQMDGFGCVIAFVPKVEGNGTGVSQDAGNDDAKATAKAYAASQYRRAQQVVAALQLPAHAVSLGGVDSLIVHAASMWEGTLGPDQLADSGIDLGLLRLSVGLEATDDLIADLDQALRG